MELIRTVDEMKELLALCEKVVSLGDDPRDTEVFWLYRNVQVGRGYWGAIKTVVIYPYSPLGISAKPLQSFFMDEAVELMDLDNNSGDDNAEESPEHTQ